VASFLVMASRLVPSKTCLITRSSRCFSGARLGGARAWKNETPTGSKTEIFVYNPESNITWPDPKLGVFNRADPNFGFPGNIGPDISAVSAPAPASKDHPDVLMSATNRENQVHALYNAHDFIKYTPGSESVVCSDILPKFPQLSGIENIDIAVHSAPSLLKKQMSELFPGQNIETAPFTVITMARKTRNDMSEWSDDVEEEREILNEQFVQAAKEVCGRLKGEGHWADFIDPCSGTPHYGPHTNTTMFETDEKYRMLGFRIEDLGCCKVITHAGFGKNVFVSCIVTNAAVGSDVLDNVVMDLNLLNNMI